VNDRSGSTRPLIIDRCAHCSRYEGHQEKSRLVHDHSLGTIGDLLHKKTKARRKEGPLDLEVDLSTLSLAHTRTRLQVKFQRLRERTRDDDQRCDHDHDIDRDHDHDIDRRDRGASPVAMMATVATHISEAEQSIAFRIRRILSRPETFVSGGGAAIVRRRAGLTLRGSLSCLYSRQVSPQTPAASRPRENNTRNVSPRNCATDGLSVLLTSPPHALQSWMISGRLSGLL